MSNEKAKKPVFGLYGCPPVGDLPNFFINTSECVVFRVFSALFRKFIRFFIFVCYYTCLLLLLLLLLTHASTAATTLSSITDPAAPLVRFAATLPCKP